MGALYSDSVPVVLESISSELHHTAVRKTTVVSEKVPIKQDLKYVHPLVQNLFPQEQRSGLPVAGRLTHFQENWKKFTSDPQILELVEDYQIPFSSEPKQTKLPNPAHLTKKEESLVDLEIQAMLRTGAIRMVEKSQNQFLSPIFLVEKKDSGYRPVINLKKLNQNIPK